MPFDIVLSSFSQSSVLFRLSSLFCNYVCVVVVVAVVVDAEVLCCHSCICGWYLLFIVVGVIISIDVIIATLVALGQSFLREAANLSSRAAVTDVN